MKIATLKLIDELLQVQNEELTAKCGEAYARYKALEKELEGKENSGDLEAWLKAEEAYCAAQREYDELTEKRGHVSAALYDFREADFK